MPGTLTITRATPSITVTPYSVTYDSNEHTATVVATGVANEGLSADVTVTDTTHTNAGTYTDSWKFTDPTGNYADQSGTVSDSIAKTNPSATFSVSNTPITYDASAHSAAVDISASSVPGSVENVSTGGAVAQTNAATYAVTADFVPTDTNNYNTLTGLSAGDFVITPAAVTVTADSQSKVYGADDPTLTYTGTLIGADTFSGALARSSDENVGTYAINQGTLSAGDNYTITFVPTPLPSPRLRLLSMPNLTPSLMTAHPVRQQRRRYPASKEAIEWPVSQRLMTTQTLARAKRSASRLATLSQTATEALTIRLQPLQTPPAPSLLILPTSLLKLQLLTMMSLPPLLAQISATTRSRLSTR